MFNILRTKFLTFHVINEIKNHQKLILTPFYKFIVLINKEILNFIPQKYYQYKVLFISEFYGEIYNFREKLLFYQISIILNHQKLFSPNPRKLMRQSDVIIVKLYLYINFSIRLIQQNSQYLSISLQILSAVKS